MEACGLMCVVLALLLSTFPVTEAASAKAWVGRLG
jgi:hypothetical protein